MSDTKVSMRITGVYLKILVSSCLCRIAMAAAVYSVSYTSAAVFMEIPKFAEDTASYMFYYSLISLVGMITVPFIGKFASGKVGPKIVILVGGTWSALCYFAFSFCGENLISWYIVGALAGITTYGTFSTAVIVLVNMWFVEHKGSALGIVAAFTGIGGALLGLIMPIIVGGLFGWQGSFRFIALIILIFGVLNVLLLVPKRGRPGDIGLQPLGYIPEDVNEGGIPSKMPGMSLKDALKSSMFWLQWIAKILVLLLTGFFANLTNIMIVDGHFDYTDAAHLVSIFSIVMVFTKILQGIIHQKTKNVKYTVIIICALGFIPCLFIPSILATGSVILLTIAFIFLSFNSGQANVMNPILTSDTFGDREFGGIWGVMAIGGTLGLTLGSPLWALIYDNTGSYNLGWYIFFGVVVLALIIYVRSISIARKKPYYAELHPELHLDKSLEAL